MDSHYCTDHRGSGSPSEIAEVTLPLDREPAPPSQQATVTAANPEPSPTPSENRPAEESKSVASHTPEAQPPEELFCHHVTHAGRRCRMLRAEGHPSLCAYHASPRPKRSQSDDDVIAADLLDGVNDFTSVFDVNVFLGNIAVQLARKRIARPDAMALSYIGQLLLNSNHAMDKELDARRNTDGFIIDFRGLKLRKPYEDDTPEEEIQNNRPSS